LIEMISTKVDYNLQMQFVAKFRLRLVDDSSRVHE
jgi:hypothetical protein